MEFMEEAAAILAHLEKRGVLMLATSYQDKVTARAISVVVYDGKIAFQTSTNLVKYQQIAMNPNVAFTVDNIQLLGKAEIKQHPFEVDRFAKSYQKKHAGSFDTYSHMRSNRVIEVTPLEVKRWDYIDGEPCIVTFDFQQKSISQVFYQHALED